MRSIVGVALNQPQSSAQEPEFERLAMLYESESSQASKATIQDVALPAIRGVTDVAPRLDITTQAEGAGTRVTAELTKTAGETQKVSIVLADVDALAATTALAEVLESSSAANTRAISDDALAIRLYDDLTQLLSDLEDLFGDIDLALFDPLPDLDNLPALDGYVFSDPYFERFWQLTWAAWSGQQPYDTEMMFGLGVRSSSVTALGVDFTRRVIDSVTDKDGAPG